MLVLSPGAGGVYVWVGGWVGEWGASFQGHPCSLLLAGLCSQSPWPLCVMFA